MDHSLRGYLKRRSLLELELLLDTYFYDPTEVMQMILSILKEREKSSTPECAAEIRILRNRYIDRLQKEMVANKK